MATGYFLDPFVLQTPDGNTAEESQAYFDAMITWGRGLREADCLTSEACVHALFDAHRYPTRERVRELIRTGVVGYSEVDVLNTLRALSETRPYLEDRFGLRDALHESTLTPSVLLDRLDDIVGEAFLCMLALLAYSTSERRDAGELALGSRDVNEPVVDLRSRVRIVESNAGQFEEPNRDYEQSFEVSLSPIPAGTPSITECYQDHLQALALMADQMNVDAPPPESVSTSPKFLKTISSCGIATSRSALRTVYRHALLAVADRLKDVAGAKLRPVRTSAAADSPQVIRADGASLWRSTITKHGAGYRLHYWRLPDGRIELDCVVTKPNV